MPVYRFLSFGAPAGGASGGYYATLYANVKPNSLQVPYCVPNELVCSRLGLFVGLPVPPGGLTLASDNKLWYGALNFNLLGAQLPPVDVDRCIALLPKLSAGLLLFDIFVMNRDRHRCNFAVNFSTNPPTMNVFDFSHAFFGTAAHAGEATVSGQKDDLGVLPPPNRHCLLDQITDDKWFQEWLERIRGIPDYVITDVMAEGRAVGLTEAEAKAGAECLRYRRDNLKGIIERHKAEFRGIKQWQLW